MGSTTVQAPNATDTASSALAAQVNIAPQQFDATSEYAPQYSDLYNQITQSSLFGDANAQGLLSTYSQAAPQLQNIQGNLNAQQAQQNIGLVGQYASSAVQAYQAANPQLEQLQNQLTGLAGSAQNPITMQGTPTQVGAGSNATIDQLNQTAQQQLALGGQVSQQQASQLSGQILANYDTQGRANDPTAVAGLATSLDTYSNQLLNQREANASTAGQDMAGVQGLNLAAGTANQSANIQAATANQNAQLQNAGYQAGLLTTAANLAQSTAQNPYQLILGQSGALSGAAGAANAASAQSSGAQSLANMYNPFTNGAFNTIYGGTLTASQDTASNNAAMISAGISAVGSAAGAAGKAGTM